MDGVAGFNYQGNTYLYRKNVQGDVTHIYKQEEDKSLTLVAEYVYDAWDNWEIVVNNADDIANLNPFRYRSYYFDTETKLYYLQTRYYDSELGRFISADSIEYLDPETLGGLNLYAYCGNNPVMQVDVNGTKGEWWEWLIFGLAVAAAITLIVLANVFTLGTVGTVMAAVGTGFLLGAGGSVVEQLSNNGWQFSEVDPAKALIEGGKAAVISGVCALGTCVLGELGTILGKEFGSGLANLSKAGIKVGQVFGGAETIEVIFGFIGNVAGVFLGAIAGQKIANDIFGEQSDFEDLLKSGFESVIDGWIGNIFDSIGGSPWQRLLKKLRRR